MAPMPVLGESLVLEIATDNTFLHIAEQNTLLSHAALEVPTFHSLLASSPVENLGVEYFSAAGVLLVPQVDATSKIIGFAPKGRAAPKTVLARIDRVLGHVQEIVNLHPDLYDRPGVPVDDVVIRTGDDTDLRATLLAVGIELNIEERLPKPDRGGWFHNAMHAAGWKHS